MGQDDRRGGQGQFAAEDRAAGSAVGSRRRARPVVGGTSKTPAWKWEAEELGSAERDELEALRVQRDALIAQIAEMQASVEATTQHAEVLRKALRRLADARWPRRRALARELRDAGLLAG